MQELDQCQECGAVVANWSTHEQWHGKIVQAIRNPLDHLDDRDCGRIIQRGKHANEKYGGF